MSVKNCRGLWGNGLLAVELTASNIAAIVWHRDQKSICALLSPIVTEAQT